jgi:hypothetical protein
MIYDLRERRSFDDLPTGLRRYPRSFFMAHAPQIVNRKSQIVNHHRLFYLIRRAFALSCP